MFHLQCLVHSKCSVFVEQIFPIEQIIVAGGMLYVGCLRYCLRFFFFCFYSGKKEILRSEESHISEPPREETRLNQFPGHKLQVIKKFHFTAVLPAAVHGEALL